MHVEFDGSRSYPRDMTVGQINMRPRRREEKCARGLGSLWHIDGGCEPRS